MGIPTLRTERLVQRFNDEPLRDVAAAAAFIEHLRAESAADARRHWAITADDEVSGRDSASTAKARCGSTRSRTTWHSTTAPSTAC